jgi:NADPH-dependent FMN reductase
MSTPKLAIVIGSIRQNRFAAHVAEWLEDIALQHGSFDVEVIDLKQYHRLVGRQGIKHVCEELSLSGGELMGSHFIVSLIEHSQRAFQGIARKLVREPCAKRFDEFSVWHAASS